MGRQFEHFFIGNSIKLAGLGNEPWVGGEHPIHIRVNVATICIQRPRQGHRGGVRPAPAHSRYAAIAKHGLVPRHHRDFAVAKAFHNSDGLDRQHPGPGRTADPIDGKLPAQPRTRRDADILERPGHQTSADLFPGGDDDIVFAIVDMTGQQAIRERDQFVRGVAHGGHHHRNVVAVVDFGFYGGGRALDALGIRDRRTAKLQNQP